MTLIEVRMHLIRTIQEISWSSLGLLPHAGLSIRAGSRPKQLVTDQPLAGYFRLILLLILVRNLK